MQDDAATVSSEVRSFLSYFIIVGASNLIYCHASRLEHFNHFNHPCCVGVPGYSTPLPVHTGNKAHDRAVPLGCVMMHINSNDHQEFLVGQIHFELTADDVSSSSSRHPQHTFLSFFLALILAFYITRSKMQHP